MSERVGIDPRQGNDYVGHVNYRVAVTAFDVDIRWTQSRRAAEVELKPIRARVEVGDCRLGVMLGEDESITTGTTGEDLAAATCDKHVALRSAVKNIATIVADDQLWRVGIFRRNATSDPTVSVVKDECILLHMTCAGIPLNDIGERRSVDFAQGLGVEPLILVPEPIAIPKVLKLTGYDLLEGFAEEGTPSVGLRKAASPKIDFVDAPESGF